MKRKDFMKNNNLSYLEYLYLIIVFLVLSIPTMFIIDNLVSSKIYWQEIFLSYQRSNFEVKSLEIEYKRINNELKEITNETK